MGILDDAIKEHLELKRQRGADASELKQLEDEAFGAAERPGDEGTAPDALAEAPTEFMQQPEEAGTEREAIAEQPTEMYEVEAELGPSEAPAPSDDELAEEEMDEPRLAPVDPLSETDEADPEDFFDEQRLSDELDQALEAPAEEDEEREELRPAEGEEDVLEETPDFLEEAPEDDRLWFEQKPPKDFDFDD